MSKRTLPTVRDVCYEIRDISNMQAKQDLMISLLCVP
jgi:hypothetical protein